MRPGLNAPITGELLNNMKYTRQVRATSLSTSAGATAQSLETRNEWLLENMLNAVTSQSTSDSALLGYKFWRSCSQPLR